jgi:hypothetical protein
MGMYCEIRAVAPDGSEALRDAPSDDPRSQSVSLEKAWHGLHFLLTGSAMEGSWPLGFLLLGGEAVGDDDAPRRLSPDSVRELNSALSATSDDEIWGRFDPDKMTTDGVYPNIWDEPEQELREEYLMYFHQLKQLIQLAAQKGDALLISIG